MSATNSAAVFSREEIVVASSKSIPRVAYVVSGVLALLGALVFIVGAVLGQSRVWQALHFNWLFFASISQAAVVFVAVQRITTARWSRSIVRMLEGFVAFLPVAFVLLLLIFLGTGHIFPWAHETVYYAERRLWLDPAFLIPRVLLLFLVSVGLSLWYVYTSVRLDVGVLGESGASWARGLRERMRRGFRDERRELHSTHSLQGKLAVWLCLVFGFFWSVLAFDLSMTLDTHFYSALYGWWFFMGGWLGALMAWSLLVMWWRKYLGAHDLITEHHFHDLGKLCFAFSAFWGYLTFGQYLIIWYGNLPTETGWFNIRLHEPWVLITMAVIFMVFVIPFFGLLSRAAKVYLPTFILFAVISLAGIWLLRFIEVYPSMHHEAQTLPFGLWEIAIFLGYLGVWGLCYAGFMDAFPRMRVVLMTSPHRDEVQVPVDPETMEPLPAHE